MEATMATHTITADNIQSSVDDNDIVVLDFWASAGVVPA